MDCCQLDDGHVGVKHEKPAGNEPENGSPDADRGSRHSGSSLHPYPDDQDPSAGPGHEDVGGSETEPRSSRHSDQVSQNPKPRGRKRKLVVEETPSADLAEPEDTPIATPISTPTTIGPGRGDSPASSNYSVPEQVNQLPSPPKMNRSEDLPESHHPGSTPRTSVKELEQAMSKHLPRSMDKPNASTTHQPTDLSTSALLKQQQQKTIQWIGTQHDQLGHLSPQHMSGSLPTSALLRQLYANRESVIRANVHGVTSESGGRLAGNESYHPEDNPQTGPLPTPPGSEGSSTYGDHQFILGHQKLPSVANPTSDVFTSLVSPYSTTVAHPLDYHSAMTPPSSVSPRDKQPQTQLHTHLGQQLQHQPHPSTVGLTNYEASIYGDPSLRHDYEPGHQTLPLKPQVYSPMHPGGHPLDPAGYGAGGLREQPQFYHHGTAGAGFQLYHFSNKGGTNGWCNPAT